MCDPKVFEFAHAMTIQRNGRAVKVNGAYKYCANNKGLTMCIKGWAVYDPPGTQTFEAFDCWNIRRAPSADWAWNWETCGGGTKIHKRVWRT